MVAVSWFLARVYRWFCGKGQRREVVTIGDWANFVLTAYPLVTNLIPESVLAATTLSPVVVVSE